MNKIPVCMIIDDPGPFLNAGTTGHPEQIYETATAFYVELGEWARDNGVRGKFSVVPICGGVAAVDGSMGEYPGHSREERLEWVDMIRNLYQPNWTITPEIITHLMPWDILNEQPLNIDNVKENDYFASLSLSEKIAYVEYAMRKLKNAGITAGGCTMCWSIPVELNADFGCATLRAVYNVYGPSNVMIFNDSFAGPEVVYRDTTGYCAVKVPPVIGDLSGANYASGNPSQQQILQEADSMISEDGQSGKFAEVIRAGKPLIFLSHIQSLATNGRHSGLKVFQISIERLNRCYSDQIQWMKAQEIVELTCQIQDSKEDRNEH